MGGGLAISWGRKLGWEWPSGRIRDKEGSSDGLGGMDGAKEGDHLGMPSFFLAEHTCTDLQARRAWPCGLASGLAEAHF